MIDTKLEDFTVEEAFEAGLVEAIFDGSAKISGTYELTPKGDIEYDQNNFVFKDKFGVLRVGRFKSQKDLIRFLLIFATADITPDLGSEKNLQAETFIETIRKVPEK